MYDPRSGKAITVYGLNSASRSLPTLNLDTFDPHRTQVYNAYNVEFRARPGAGSQVFGGIAIERERTQNCTAPDNPNSLRFCDQYSLEEGYSVPWKKTLKLAGSYPLPYGILFSAALQSNMPRDNASHLMTITRGVSRYPANCAAPCPAGAIIGPTAVMGQSSLSVQLDPTSTVLAERITQFDFKVQRSFRFGRVSVLPTLEVFNLNNSDAIISYQSQSILSPAYLAPNSIMQPRMVGVGATVRW